MSFPKWGPGDTGLAEPDQYIKVPQSDLPLSVVKEARGLVAPSLYYDNGAIGGDTNAPNLSIGGTMPYIANGAYSNIGIGADFSPVGDPPQGSLSSITTGSNNLGIGMPALPLCTTGSENTAIGADTLEHLTTGTGNTAVGMGAAFAITTGDSNVAVGTGTLQAATTTANNTAVGTGAGQNLVGGTNTALGAGAMTGATGASGSDNTAVGKSAMTAVTSGQQNTAVGVLALQSMTTAVQNTAVGGLALGSCSVGGLNTAVGYNANQALTGANWTTALGANTAALQNGSVAIGIDSSGAGASANLANAFVLGTASHKLFIPGLPTADPAVAGQLYTAGAPSAGTPKAVMVSGG